MKIFNRTRIVFERHDYDTLQWRNVTQKRVNFYSLVQSKVSKMIWDATNML